MTIIKKSLIILLSIFFTVNGMQFIFSKEPSDQDNVKRLDIKVLPDIAPEDKRLVQSVDWIKLKKIWKELNHFKDNKGFLATSKYFEKIENDFKSAFSTLIGSKLLTDSEKNFFEKLFNDRVEYLKHTSYQSACYQLCDSFETIIKTRKDLEDRYDTLEKLFKQKKINLDAYKTAKESIIKDLEVLNKETAYSTFKNPVETNDNNLNLLIDLNK